MMQENLENTENSTDTRTVRRSRNADTRAFETRSATSRPPLVYGLISRFNFPDEVIQDYRDKGYVVGWVVYSSGNTEQRENYFHALDRGWIPIRASDHPTLVRNYDINPFGKRDEIDQFLLKGGQIGMILPIELFEAESEYYNSENRRIEYMRDLHKMHQLDPRSPAPFLDERRKERVYQ